MSGPAGPPAGAPLHRWSAAAIAAAVRDGSLRAAEVTDAFVRRIAAEDGALAAFVEVFAGRARECADRVDRRRARGEDPGPLAGVPVALKDNLLCAGRTAACGSRMLEDFVAPYSATVVERLEQLGAIPIGRTNMDEFGMGSSTEHSAFGPTRNPWARDRVPGGSSGGSAAAVAADLCPLALGSDTGGSVRQPAALCGIAGLKPTYGRLSRRGLVAFASSLDCVGLFARTAADLALGMRVAGADPGDATASAAPAPDLLAGLGDGPADLRGLHVGLPAQWHSGGIDGPVAAAVAAATGTLRDLGAVTLGVDLPNQQHAISAYYLIAAAEASSNLARYDGVRFGRGGEGRTVEALYADSRSQGFGAEVQLRVLLGTFALQHGYRDEVYGQATRVRALLQQDFVRAFARCDVVLGPTSPFVAFPFGSRTADPVAMYACDALTVPPSLCGVPALSLPCGFAAAEAQGGAPAAELPVGLQLVAPAFREDLLLRIAHAFQQRTDWHERRPLP